MILKNSNGWNKKDFQILISDSKSSDHGYQCAIANSKHPGACRILYFTRLSHMCPAAIITTIPYKDKKDGLGAYCAVKDKCLGTASGDNLVQLLH